MVDQDLDFALSRAAEQLKGYRVISVGSDLVDIDRMRAVMGRQPSFAQRVFTSEERRYCGTGAISAERFAARFAAKEAVLKALGVGLGGADFHDIEVIRQESGQPELNLTGRAVVLAKGVGIKSWLVTISHSQSLAYALVAGLGDGQAL